MSRFNAQHRGTVILPTAAKYTQFIAMQFVQTTPCSRQEQTSCVYHIILRYRYFEISHLKALFHVHFGRHLWQQIIFQPHSVSR